MSTIRKLKVFLCHASQDKPAVRELYARLSSETWIDPWLDEEMLLPGMDWDLEIQKALRDADSIIVCLSSESVAKEGYVQREFKRALSYAEEKPDGTIYIIPLRLNECTLPIRFQQWQWIDYFEGRSHDKLFKSLRLRAEKLGISTKTIREKESVAIPNTASNPHPEPSNFTKGGRPLFTFGGLEFVKVTGGDFYMGSDDIEVARPQHLVYQLSNIYYLGQYPVTNQEYSSYLRDMGQDIVMARGMEKYPVAGVSWLQAQDYIRWLNEKYAHKLPSGYKFRLPSEAEWEKCARGWEGNIYPWGKTFDARRCNSKESRVGTPSPVGSYSPQGDSAYGAADMAGNVWEWTRTLRTKDASIFDYPYRFDDGREVEDETAEYVLRGGSFKSAQQEIQCANRMWSPASGTDSDFGFRVAICPMK